MKAIYIDPSFKHNHLNDLNMELKGSDKIISTITLVEGGITLIVNNSRQDKINHLNNKTDNDE